MVAIYHIRNCGLVYRFIYLGHNYSFIFDMKNLSCLKCNGNHTHRNGKGCVIWAFALLLLINTGQTCRDCGFTWK